ncbi:MAG: aconitase family protein [Bacteroidia bacterium]|nr:aconitase family protein [Bacteroidia bacterium]
MNPKTFAEKIFKAPAGAIVFARPDIILTHDNTSSIYKTFQKMEGKNVADPDQMLVVLDHNAPPADAKLATQYQEIRDIVALQGIKKFYDAGKGICHQIMSYHARPGMLIVGSDNLALWIIGMIGSDGANYMSIEYHGKGVETLDISDRMTIANLASEMGAKNAVFPLDDVLNKFYNEELSGIWADEGAKYFSEININLSDIFPVVAAPHNVDNVKSVAEVAGTVVHEGLIGTCTNGRIEDMRITAEILHGKMVKDGFQLHIIPASRKIFLQAIEEGIISTFIKSGANVLTPSCGPCLGTGQGIPANGHTVISTANRNFPGRMGNKEAQIYLASPATVAHSSLTGVITDPRENRGKDKFPYKIIQSKTFEIKPGENRKSGSTWNYADVDNLNTDQMFAGKHTYNILSTDPEAIMPLLFEDFDPGFSKNVKKGDIIIAGENFGCGSSREHPSVGLSFAGIKAIIVKSVNRIFYRSSINQSLVLIVHKEAVEAYKPGDQVNISFDDGEILIGSERFTFEPLPEKLKQIIDRKGLVNYMKTV